MTHQRKSPPKESLEYIERGWGVVSDLDPSTPRNRESTVEESHQALGGHSGVRGTCLFLSLLRPDSRRKTGSARRGLEDRGVVTEDVG